MDKARLKNLHSTLIDALERMYLGAKGQPRIDAIRDAIEAYEALIVYWGERKEAMTPDVQTYIKYKGKRYRLRHIRGTLARYSPDDERFRLEISRPANPTEAVREREIGLGYGRLLDKMDWLVAKGLTPTPKNED